MYFIVTRLQDGSFKIHNLMIKYSCTNVINQYIVTQPINQQSPCT